MLTLKCLCWFQYFRMDAVCSSIGTPLKEILSENFLIIREVAANGHCLLNAVQEVLQHDEHIAITTAEIIAKLQDEVSQNFLSYKDFLSDGLPFENPVDDRVIVQKFTTELEKYLQLKSYSSDTVDICIPILCNALDMTLIVFDKNDEGNVSKIQHTPLRHRLSTTQTKYIVHVLRSGRMFSKSRGKRETGSVYL